MESIDYPKGDNDPPRTKGDLILDAATKRRARYQRHVKALQEEGLLEEAGLIRGSVATEAKGRMATIDFLNEKGERIANNLVKK